MIDSDFIQAWRDQYGDIYTATLGDVDYYFRALTLDEIEHVQNRFVDEPSSAELEDAYVELGVVYPKINIDRIKAGYVSSLAEQIMYVSGISDVEFTITTLDAERIALTEDIIGMMKVFVLTAMPSLTDEYLNSLNLKQLIKKVIQSEKILSLQQEVNGIASDGGVQFKIIAVQEEQAKPNKAVNKEELLRRIRKDEREMSNRTINTSVLEQLDEHLLEKAAGTIDPNDPIARKLMGALR